MADQKKQAEAEAKAAEEKLAADQKKQAEAGKAKRAKLASSVTIVNKVGKPEWPNFLVEPIGESKMPGTIVRNCCDESDAKRAYFAHHKAPSPSKHRLKVTQHKD